jgi:hypothetical protein
MFAGKPRSSPKKDKHYSLFCVVISNEEKKFYNTDTLSLEFPYPKPVPHPIKLICSAIYEHASLPEKIPVSSASIKARMF